MACTKVIQVRREITAYLPSISSILSVIRRNNVQARAISKALCSDAASQPKTHEFDKHQSKALASSWPLDPKFPLPGSCAVDVTQIAESNTSRTRAPHKTLAAALLEVEDEEMKKYRVLNQFVDAQGSEMTCAADMELPNPSNVVEFTTSNCPEILIKNFRKLLSGLPDDSSLTVINICQRTRHDMSIWSAAVESEREELLDTFIKNAMEICDQLQKAGYWADFVDPSSGQAYFSDHSNETFFETDERYNLLGFEIDDLGCCKVVRHKSWGTHIFLGTIFTNAPSDSDILKGFRDC